MEPRVKSSFYKPMNEETSEQSKELIRAIEEMSALSPAAMKIISLSNDMRTEPSDLVDAISMDPMLMAKVLKLVNSAYFGSAGGIASLSRAVILLGFNTIKNIALSVAVSASINVRDTFKWYNNEQFWEHSLACALLSKSIATKTGVPPLQLEEYFVSGLLHDIGKVVLIKKYESDCEEIFDPDFEPSKSVPEKEKERFGISHDKLGEMISSKWKFPESLSSGIGFHHNPSQAPEEHTKIATVVRISDITVHRLKIGIQTGGKVDTIAPELFKKINLAEDEFESMTLSLAESVEEAKSFLAN